MSAATVRPLPRLVPLAADHAEAAAALVVAGITRLRERVPVLPAAWTDEAVVARLVRALADRGNGMALVHEDGALAGFQAATMLDGHGGRWAYTPDVGHATAAAGRAVRTRGGAGSAGLLGAERAIERLYAALAERWVREACV
ncbi:MAG TPA: hypothetical protein VFY23_02855, partial [Candidatus Limnocylindrales bacterium]|nr:hypothetical protein [Candidatus Limnocylindrales bacterium]